MGPCDHTCIKGTNVIIINICTINIIIDVLNTYIIHNIDTVRVVDIVKRVMYSKIDNGHLV